MAKKFENPELEVIRFEDADMITTSGGCNDVCNDGCNNYDEDDECNFDFT